MAAKVFGEASPEAIQREADRLAALQHFDLLDTPRDAAFERIVRLIKAVLAVDIALISLIDGHRQWYQACSGLFADEVPLQDSFCRFVVAADEPVIVPDATLDYRFAQHPAVTGESHIRFYAGVPLRTGDGHTIGTVCAIDRQPRSLKAGELAILEELAGAAMDRIELLRTASTDSLTEAMTRRAFKEEAEQMVGLALRHRHPLACIVLDIDHFKKINDGFGHAAGDAVLKAVAGACRQVLRAGDLFGRLGGEEFAIILPHADAQGAASAAEKLRAAIEARSVDGAPGVQGVLGVTASFGISALSIVAKDVETLLAHADAAMYQAKHDGRNRCVSWSMLQASLPTGSRRRVLKAGSILFNDRRSSIDCTVRSLGADSAGLAVSNSADIPPAFVLRIDGEGFETRCQVISQDRQHLEVVFR